MRKERYVYNKSTLSFEKEKRTTRQKLMIFFGFLSATIISGMIFVLIFNHFFPSPKEVTLSNELAQMEYKYNLLENQLGLMDKVLNNMRDRDVSVHRMIFGIDPVDDDVWNGGQGGFDKYKDIVDYGNSSEIIKNVQTRADKLARQMTLQSKSLDTMVNLASEREKMFASIPALKPVREDQLKRGIRALSGFGMRLHPILKIRKMHTGLDFTAPRGTDVQASGDGKVVKVVRKTTGYGKHIVIDHGYGYKSLYAHLQKFDVKKGDQVVRGQKIGEVGNTGTSTAPHLHYEVIYKNRKVDPINFVLDGLSPDEYQELVNEASKMNQSFD
jgi:hypothetical protein